MIRYSIIIVGLYFLLQSAIVYGQSKSDNRFPNQRYYEDSTHVYWTWYPNPFSPSTISDTGKGQNYSGYSFYCDMSDSVIISLVDENDSIRYSAPVKSLKPPYFSIYNWIAGPRINQSLLPKATIRHKTDRSYNLLLSVSGRRKCLMTCGLTVPKDWYFWFTDMYQVNK